MRDRKRRCEFELAYQCSGKQKDIITMNENHNRRAAQRNELDRK